MSDKILAIDIGGSKVIAGLTDFQGNLLCCERHDFPEKYSAAFLLDTVCALSGKFLSEGPVAAGVTVPGLADREKGIWRYAPFSGLADIPIAAYLQNRLKLPVFAENDVNACAIAESRFGICRGVSHFLWITVSNGIGGAVYIDGKLVSGDFGAAGEIGHFIVEENDGNPCGCGKSGCLEAMASGTAIAVAYRKLTGENCSAKEIAERAKDGEKDALLVYRTAGHYIGKAVSYCVNLLNLSRIVVGGGVGQDLELLRGGMESALARYVFARANPEVRIDKTKFGYYAGMAGCAAIAAEELEKQPVVPEK